MILSRVRLLLLIPLASYLINRRAQRLQRLVGTLIASVALNLGFVSVPARDPAAAVPPRPAGSP